MRVILCVVAAVSVVAACVAVQAAAGTRSPCHANQSYQQALQAGVLPAVLAALHGGAPVSTHSAINCSTRRP